MLVDAPLQSLLFRRIYDLWIIWFVYRICPSLRLLLVLLFLNFLVLVLLEPRLHLPLLLFLGLEVLLVSLLLLFAVCLRSLGLLLLQPPLLPQPQLAIHRCGGIWREPILPKARSQKHFGMQHFQPHRLQLLQTKLQIHDGFLYLLPISQPVALAAHVSVNESGSRRSHQRLVRHLKRVEDFRAGAKIMFLMHPIGLDEGVVALHLRDYRPAP
mmetsp:Transcript_10643/g.18255  ORF Transcript_10643/g.18255 Transcript_10643/m.18255 type:complete len:213 (+) Transcript_10643:577-1215(+)